MTKQQSEYELARLERIRENQQMLKELFPNGSPKFDKVVTKSTRSIRRKRSDDNDSEESGDSETEDNRKKARYSLSMEKVTPRRNPARQKRAVFGDGPTTRSMSKTAGHELTEGLQDEQVKRFVYRTYRRRESTDEDLPVELDGKPGIERHEVKTVKNGSDKQYCRISGVTCHQCRQKTIDTKTICHNINCKGTRGQFCGPCLLNRYGEDLVESLADNQWVCPPCRKICNCSICMPKRGKAPTGVMIHIARECGFDSVHEYLDKSASSEA